MNLYWSSVVIPGSIFYPVTICPRYSTNLLDTYGKHSIVCGKVAERKPPHNRFFKFVAQQTLHNTSRVPDLQPRPRDIVLLLWSGGKNLAIDVNDVFKLQRTLPLRRNADLQRYALKRKRSLRGIKLLENTVWFDNQSRLRHA